MSRSVKIVYHVRRHFFVFGSGPIATRHLLAIGRAMPCESPLAIRMAIVPSELYRKVNAGTSEMIISLSAGTCRTCTATSSSASALDRSFVPSSFAEAHRFAQNLATFGKAGAIQAQGLLRLPALGHSADETPLRASPARSLTSHGQAANDAESVGPTGHAQ